MTDTINGRTPEEIRDWLSACNAFKCEAEKCPYFPHLDCNRVLNADALALIQQLEEEKKHLQERICNQRRQLRVLHAMYEWALGRLQKAKLNDRAHFQAFLRERGYDLATMELPETRYQQLENHIGELTEMVQQLKRERTAAVEQLKEVDREDAFRCSHCIHDELCNDGLTSCIDCDKDCPCHTCENGSNWQWRGVQEGVKPDEQIRT